MEFEWDTQKNKTNIEKHKIDFADAVLIFEDFILEYEDLRRLWRKKILRNWSGTRCRDRGFLYA